MPTFEACQRNLGGYTFYFHVINNTKLKDIETISCDLNPLISIANYFSGNENSSSLLVTSNLSKTAELSLAFGALSKPLVKCPIIFILQEKKLFIPLIFSLEREKQTVTLEVKKGNPNLDIIYPSKETCVIKIPSKNRKIIIDVRSENFGNIRHDYHIAFTCYYIKEL